MRGSAQVQGARAGSGLVDGAVGAITRHIREHGLGPGDRLPSEAALSQDLGVSRTVVREAFRSLAAVRVIDLGAGRRATVSPIDAGAMAAVIEHGVGTDQITIPQVYDLRRTIEARVAALAALRRSDAEAKAIAGLAAGMRGLLDDPPALMERDISFHGALAEASRNPAFALIVGAFAGVTRQTWPVGWRSRTDAAGRGRMVAGHEAIAGAVRAGDPEAAAAAMNAHFDESVRALLTAGLA
jgi:GntR family transcriptional repressor for pyruvate dehydrogenase complex